MQQLKINEESMITAGQLRAARALIAIDQRELVALSGLAVPTIQRMMSSEEPLTHS